jgi:hypothetical protein
MYVLNKLYIQHSGPLHGKQFKNTLNDHSLNLKQFKNTHNKQMGEQRGPLQGKIVKPEHT